MQTFALYVVSLVLAFLPLMTAGFFLIYTVPRKILEVRIDISKLRANRPEGRGDLFSSSGPDNEPEKNVHATEDGPTFPGTPDSQSSGGDVERLVRGYLRTSALLVPASILTVLYVAAYLLCDAHLLYFYWDHRGQLLFSADFLTACSSSLYAFLGVYVFNLGAMTRRVYLGDMNEQVFWGAINRLILSVGLAVVVMRVRDFPGPEGPAIYFTIGFTANIVLQWLLERALKLLNIAKPKRDDLPLQMVRGINLWKEYRLDEEGIESVQNLATANILELAARTHYNVRTLIDWIDQSIVLSLLTIEQVATLNKQAFAISAIDLAASSPQSRGDSVVSDELARVLDVSPVLMASMLNSLYQDRYLRELWISWQIGREAGLSETTAIGTAAPGQLAT